MELWKLALGIAMVLFIGFWIYRWYEKSSLERDVLKYEQEKCDVAVKNAHTNPGNKEAAKARKKHDLSGRAHESATYGTQNSKRKDDSSRNSDVSDMSNVVLIHSAASSVENTASTTKAPVETPAPDCPPASYSDTSCSSGGD